MSHPRPVDPKILISTQYLAVIRPVVSSFRGSSECLSENTRVDPRSIMPDLARLCPARSSAPISPLCLLHDLPQVTRSELHRKNARRIRNRICTPERRTEAARYTKRCCRERQPAYFQNRALAFQPPANDFCGGAVCQCQVPRCATSIAAP